MASYPESKVERERNVRQVMPAPVQGSGLCDNGFQEIELGVMG